MGNAPLVSRSVVASCGTVKLIEEGPYLHFVGTPSDSFGTLSMVLGIVGANVVGLALVSVFIGGLGAAIVTFPFAGLFVGAFFLSWTTRKRRLTSEGPLLLTIDRANDCVRIGARPVCRVGQARIAAVTQMTSSSKALVVDTPDGNLIVARGVPGISSVRGMVLALQQRGIFVA